MTPRDVADHVNRRGIPRFADPDTVAAYTDGTVVASRRTADATEVWRGRAVGWVGHITLKGHATTIARKDPA